jgi:hypothetical protein
MTNSVVSTWRDGRVEIIADDQGNRITPSVVAFTPDGERLIGEAAKSQMATNPKNTVFDVKRLIGCRYDSKELQRQKKLLPYAVVEKENEPVVSLTVKGVHTLFSPEEISAMIVAKLKETAEAYLGQPVKHAVVKFRVKIEQSALVLRCTALHPIVCVSMLRASCTRPTTRSDANCSAFACAVPYHMKMPIHAELRLLMCLPMHCEERMELPFRQPRY